MRIMRSKGLKRMDKKGGENIQNTNPEKNS